MNDKNFLTWLHQLLLLKHGEDFHTDYMSRLRAVINSTSDTKFTPNTGCETLEQWNTRIEFQSEVF